MTAAFGKSPQPPFSKGEEEPPFEKGGLGGFETGELERFAEPVLARIAGEPLLTLPHDLYIPPDALAVFLELFEGPLDLLLYLIQRQNLDLLNISLTDITTQYLAYVELMTSVRWELAADYLVMAATLAELKSRLLLPSVTSAGEEQTPEELRSQLIQRLQDYALIKQAAQDLDALPRLERDVFAVHVALPPNVQRRIPPPVELRHLLLALREVLARADLFTHHRIAQESLSLRERMSAVLTQLQNGALRFGDLYDWREGRAGVVVTLLALLELLKAHLIELAEYDPSASSAASTAAVPPAELWFYRRQTTDN
jgi:segregation and condensation protein A